MPKGIYSRDKQCEKCRGAGIVFNAIIRRYQQFADWRLSSDCMYNRNGRCCHASAIAEATAAGRIYTLVKVVKEVVA